MIGGALIAEGGYGCIYYPSLNESGEEEKNNCFVSKIQVINDAALNEIHVGTIIKNINGYIIPDQPTPIISQKKRIVHSSNCRTLRQS